MSKKVLIITYYWPPAGGPGVQRWLKFVKYLPDFSIEPIVYIPENPNYPLIDETLNKDVPKGLTILKQPINEPYKFAGFLSKKSKTISKGLIPDPKKQALADKLMLYIRGNFYIPDARKNWVEPSVSYLNKYLLENSIDTIITTGPPHSLHLIGMKLKSMLGVKWIADFRDPWTTIGYHKELKLNAASKKKHITLEKQVLNAADHIIVTSSVTQKEFEAKSDKPITVITNGYDTEKVEQVTLDSKFSLAHIGSLLSKRNPEVLWKVLYDLVNENKAFAEHLEIKFVGAVSDVVLKSIAKMKLDKYVNNIGYVTHTESIKQQRQAQVLLLIEIDSDDTKAIIPGKLFEYMVSNRPILAVGPTESDVEQIIKETNTGHYFNYNSYTAIKNVILNHFIAFQESNLEVHAIGLQKYSRRALTKTLVNIL